MPLEDYKRVPVDYDAENLTSTEAQKVYHNRLMIIAECQNAVDRVRDLMLERNPSLPTSDRDIFKRIKDYLLEMDQEEQNAFTQAEGLYVRR